MKCEYCNSPMKENDVFCKSCWKITPKVQEMIDSYPNRHPNDYQIYSADHCYRCPHCGGFYKSNFFDKIPGLKIDSPIKRCKKCHKYLLDHYNNEWSVASDKYKMHRRFSPWLLLRIEYFLIELFLSEPWGLAVCVGYLFLHFPLCILMHNLTKRNAIKRSMLRLENNSDYPKILADMGYGFALDTKYHNLIKYPKQKLTMKEILKEAVTFDEPHHP